MISDDGEYLDITFWVKFQLIDLLTCNQSASEVFDTIVNTFGAHAESGDVGADIRSLASSTENGNLYYVTGRTYATFTTFTSTLEHYPTFAPTEAPTCAPLSYDSTIYFDIVVVSYCCI